MKCGDDARLKKEGNLVLYANIEPASGPQVAVDIKKGKLVGVEELQCHISNKTNSNGVSPILRNSNGLEPNDPLEFRNSCTCTPFFNKREVHELIGD
jgi:hypothetical protein